MTAPARRALAHHEAGHACVAEHLGHRVAMVSIERGEDYEGTYELVQALPGDHPDVGSIALAGMFAELRLTGDFEGWRKSLTLSTDLKQALMAVRGDEATFNRALKRTADSVNQCWPQIEALAAALEQRGTLRGRELGLRFLSKSALDTVTNGVLVTGHGTIQRRATEALHRQAEGSSQSPSRA